MTNPYIKYFPNGNKNLESYYIKDKLHNPNGPAIIYYDENRSIKGELFYINDKFLKQVNSIQELKKYIKLQNIN